MRRRAFIRTAAGLFVPAVTGLAQVPLSVGDPAFLGRRHAAGGGGSCTGQGATWAAQVVTNGGAAPSSTSICALDTFWSALVTASIDTKMLSVLCVAPDSLIAAITPLYKTVGNTPWTNHNFVSGDLTVNGMAGNVAGAKYLDTGIYPDVAYPDQTSAGMSIYVSSNPGASDGCELGTASGNTFLINVAHHLVSSHTLFDCWNSGARLQSPGSMASFTGFMSGNKTASNAVNLYTANSGTPWSSIASTTTNAGNATHTLMLAWALWNSGPSQYSPRRLSFLALHKGLSSSEGQALYNAVQAMRTALGGGYT